MKKVTIFTSIFLILTLVFLCFFGVSTNAEMISDSNDLDNVSYIRSTAEVPTGPKTSAHYGNLSYFTFVFNETSNFNVPGNFISTKQMGEFHLYFNASWLVASGFTQDISRYKLRVKDGNDNLYGEYFPSSVVFENFDDVYHLAVLFDSYNLETLNITNNNWIYYFQFNGDFAVNSQITVVNLYRNQEVFPSHFSWTYYGDLSSNEFYQLGYADGSANGYDIGYEDGYSNGFDLGYESGSGYGYDIGYQDGSNDGYDLGYDYGYQKGIDVASDNTFYGIIAQVFTGLGAFLSIELLPNITFGAILAVPLVFGIISFIIGKRGGKDD